MSDTSQERTLNNYRKRLKQRGMARFEVLGLDAGRELIRRYQNPALADLLNGLMGETVASRDRLRSYVVDLAAIKEQELAIMDQEAQRCRATISRQPAPRPAKSDQKKEKK